MTESWWHRQSDGSLLVRCASGQWEAAPIPVASGKLIGDGPNRHRISAALDLGYYDGPEVDEALGVLTERARVVDYWELGAIAPSAADIGRLATLTGFSPEWFCGGPLAETSNLFMCGSGVLRHDDPQIQRSNRAADFPPLTLGQVVAMPVGDFLSLRATLPALVGDYTPAPEPPARRLRLVST